MPPTLGFEQDTRDGVTRGMSAARPSPKSICGDAYRARRHRMPVQTSCETAKMKLKLE